MLANELCSYVKEEGIASRKCKVFDDTALAVDIGIKSLLMGILRRGYNYLMFYEERVSSDGRIVIRAIPRTRRGSI